MREVAPTKSEALALAEERKLMRDSLGFLDEKRMLLAAEILRQLALYEKRNAELESARKTAMAALGEVIERHGLEELQLMQAEKPFAAPKTAASTYLGVALLHRIEELEHAIKPAALRTLNLTPEVKTASAAFNRLAEIMLEAALLSANLLRLAREYRRTERRARALENVLLPEVSAMLKHVTEQLDAFDQEEAARAHTFALPFRSLSHSERSPGVVCTQTTLHKVPESTAQ
jgi:V/A-type H+-transporting ATPase subunit D